MLHCVVLCFRGIEKTKGLGKMALLYATPFLSQSSKQTIWSSLILVFSLLFSTLSESCDSKKQVDSPLLSSRLHNDWCSLWCLLPAHFPPVSPHCLSFHKYSPRICCVVSAWQSCGKQTRWAKLRKPVKHFDKSQKDDWGGPIWPSLHYLTLSLSLSYFTAL